MLVARKVVRRWRRAVRDRGMSTAEYAVGTVAAAAFAGVLFKLVSTPEVRALLLGNPPKRRPRAGGPRGLDTRTSLCRRERSTSARRGPAKEDPRRPPRSMEGVRR